MPSFCIRDCSVDRLIPKRAAAPFGPATVQLVCSSAATICWRSVSSSTSRMLRAASLGLADWFPGAPARASEFEFDARRSSLGMFKIEPLVRITARSITFCSSRMFPGHGYLTSVVMVSDGMVSIALLMRRLILLYEVPHQQRNVFRTLAQRRDADRKHVEAVVQIGAELLFADQSFEIAIGGRDQASVGTQGSRRTQALEFALLQNAQQLRLEIERYFADLVQEHGAAIGQLKAPNTLRDRAR